MPSIELSDSRRRLGGWNAATRTLTISTYHLMADVWLEVEETLRHEMAHQIVSELFVAHDAPPHGALFERACQMLDLVESPRLDRAADPASERVLRRIRKLLSLATSDNPNEAQSAAAMANRMLLEHNLTPEVAAGSDCAYRWIGTPVGRISAERKLLAALCRDFLFVRTIWIQTRRAHDERPVYVLELDGRPHNLEIAEYTHDFLAETVDRLWSTYRLTLEPHERRAARNSYRVGLLTGFREHLEGDRRRAAEAGLVWLGDAAAAELLERRYPSRRTIGGGRYRVGSAYDSGVERGRRIRVSKAVSTTRSRGKLLP